MLRLLAWLGSMKWEWSFIKFQLKKCTTRQWKKYGEGELYRPYYRAARVTSHTVIFLLCWKRPAVKKSISVFQRLIVWKAVFTPVTELPCDFYWSQSFSLTILVKYLLQKCEFYYKRRGNVLESLWGLFGSKASHWPFT